MRLTCDRFLLRVALIGALAAALGLAACGRKGLLDPPPGASLEGEPQANMPSLMSKSKGARPGAPGQDATTEEVDEEVIGPDGRPMHKRVKPKKTFVLDPLLN